MWPVLPQIRKHYHSAKFNSLSLGFRYEDPKKAAKYFCTPKKAKIFASIGVDGIHYCTIPDFGETVFAVTPMTSIEHHVFPVAHDLTEFLRLIVTLRGTGLIDQAPLFTKEHFEDLMREQADANEIEVKRLCETFNIEPLECSPYDLIMDLYNNFDYSKIEYSREYYETLGLY